MRERHDGFTAEKRQRFLETLAATGCISDAAKVAPISRKTVNYWRDRDADFASQCAAALHKAAAHIDTLAWERGVTGIEEPVFAYGKKVGTRVKRSDAIFRMILMASDPEKYGRMGAVRRQEIEREVRAKIEAERARWGGRPRARNADELRASINAKLDEAERRLREQREGGAGGD